MRATIFVMVTAAMIATVGCVSTVNDRTTMGVPFVKDRVEGRYVRTVDQVFEASKEVIKKDGVITRDGNLYETNVVKVVEGRVNQCHIWVRVQPVDQKTTSVTVQARTKAGGSNMDLAFQIEKEIALTLK